MSHKPDGIVFMAAIFAVVVGIIVSCDSEKRDTKLDERIDALETRVAE